MAVLYCSHFVGRSFQMIPDLLATVVGIHEKSQ